MSAGCGPAHSVDKSCAARSGWRREVCLIVRQVGSTHEGEIALVGVAPEGVCAATRGETARCGCCGVGSEKGCYCRMRNAVYDGLPVSARVQSPMGAAVRITE